MLPHPVRLWPQRTASPRTRRSRSAACFLLNQCWGSGSVCFWASWIRIRLRILLLYHQAKIVRKTLIPSVLWLLVTCDYFEGFLIQGKTFTLCDWGKEWFFLDFLRIRDIKRGKRIFQKCSPFSALSVQKRPKFGRRFVRPLYFYSAPFELWGRPIGHLATLPRPYTVLGRKKEKTIEINLRPWHILPTLKRPS